MFFLLEQRGGFGRGNRGCQKLGTIEKAAWASHKAGRHNCKASLPDVASRMHLVCMCRMQAAAADERTLLFSHAAAGLTTKQTDLQVASSDGGIALSESPNASRSSFDLDSFSLAFDGQESHGNEADRGAKKHPDGVGASELILFPHLATSAQAFWAVKSTHGSACLSDWTR